MLGKKCNENGEMLMIILDCTPMVIVLKMWN